MIKQSIAIALLLIWIFNIMDAGNLFYGTSLAKHKSEVAEKIRKTRTDKSIMFHYHQESEVNWYQDKKEILADNGIYDVIAVHKLPSGDLEIEAVFDHIEKELLKKANEQKRKHSQSPTKIKFKKLNVSNPFPDEDVFQKEIMLLAELKITWTKHFKSREDKSVPKRPPAGSNS